MCENLRSIAAFNVAIVSSKREHFLKYFYIPRKLLYFLYVLAKFSQ